MSVYSHSRLTSFENCALQYRLRYVDEVEVERRENIEAFVGQRVHEILQLLHERLRDGILLTEGELLGQLRSAWERTWHDAVLIVRRENSREDYRRAAERCVEHYYRANAPFDADRTLGTEVEVLFTLDAERDVRIRGYIDRLSTTGNGCFEIHDYKTSRRLPSQVDLDRDRQLGLYQMAVAARYPEAREIRLVWHYLAHGRRFQGTRHAGALERLRRETLAVVARIERATAEGDFPAHRSRLCDWCEFRAVCPAWNPVQESFLEALGALDAPRGGR
jgi:putative RecB family exonuclease